MTYDNKMDLLEQTFTPAYPVENRELFSGRVEQLSKLLETVQQRGMHGILYGERGVGKTSISNILKIILEYGSEASDYIVAKHSCYSEDSFVEVWRKIFQEIRVPNRLMIGEERGTRPAARSDGFVRLSSIIKEDFVYSPREIVRALSNIKVGKIVIILDEYDRLSTSFNRNLFADVLKNIADSHPNVKLVIVGVGSDVNDIIGEHESVKRNLRQIYIPLMNAEEIKNILMNGLRKLNMSINLSTADKLISLSSGYPYYIHLLAYYAAKNAIINSKECIDDSDMQFAIGESIAGSQEATRVAYQNATLANQVNNYKEVLYACALVSGDEHGFFQASDLERILSRILGKSTKVPQFARHLSKLSSVERGNILVCVGDTRRRRYKLKDPLMKAYIRMKVAHTGLSIDDI